MSEMRMNGAFPHSIYSLIHAFDSYYTSSTPPHMAIELERHRVFPAAPRRHYNPMDGCNASVRGPLVHLSSWLINTASKAIKRSSDG